LPFVLPRVFRPTLLAVFDITNLEFGSYFSAYGVVAIVAYLLGGPLADRFPASSLMAAALASTAAGGLYMATIPDTQGMVVLYAAWGLTTILLFWAAMLRATRIAGGSGHQGLAFGVLEGGRGLVSALIATVGVAVLGQVFPQGGNGSVDVVAQREGFQAVVYAFSGFVILMSVVVFFGLRGLDEQGKNVRIEHIDWARVGELARLPQVWLQALIILCAYSGYRVLDDVSLLASDVLGYDDVAAARLGGLSLFMRPVAAIAGGLLADRYYASKISGWAFALMVLGSAVLTFGALGVNAWLLVWTAVLVSCLGVYALRGLYFALTDEGRIPLALTGTAIGLASVVGYLPDVYMPPLTGWLLDSWPGVTGHRLNFALGIGFGVVGWAAVWLFGRRARGLAD